MSKGTVSVHCTDCGASIDNSADTAAGLAPCPSCGGAKRTVTAHAGPMQPSNHLLDNFVAHRLSALTVCGAPEIPDEANWWNSFILTTVYRVSIDGKTRAYVFNFIRRAQGAFSSYRQARSALIEYVETPRNVLSPYFKALTNFELCISPCYQGYELLATASGQRLFEKDDNSDSERLQKLYVDWKHIGQMIDGGKLPTEATAAGWITDEGLESSRAKLSFKELVEMLLQMKRLSERLSNLDASVNGVVTDPGSDAPSV